jgi:hypothetical protein
VPPENLSGQDWEVLFEADGGLIQLASHAQSPESLKKIGRLIIGKLFVSDTPEDKAGVNSETANLDNLCDLNFDFNQKKDHFVKWLRSVKNFRIKEQKESAQAEVEEASDTVETTDTADTIISPNAEKTASIPNITATDKEDQDKALSVTVEKAVREIIADEIRSQFRAKIEKCFLIPEYSLSERFNGMRLPWPLAPDDMDRMLDAILPLVLQLQGGELSAPIGNVISEVTKLAKKKGLKGYKQGLPAKNSPERAKHLAARRVFLDNLIPEIRPMYMEYVEGRENRQPLGMFGEGLRLLRKVESEKSRDPDNKEKNSKFQNSAIHDQIMEKIRFTPSNVCDLNDFKFADLSVISVYVRSDQCEKDFSRLLGKADQWMEKIRDKRAKGEQPNSADFENVYKEIINFSLDNRMVIPEIFALMMFFKVPDFNLRQLTSFRAFKISGESKKPLINRFIKDYIADFGEKIGLLINKFDAGEAAIDEKEVLARSINDCFDISAQPPTKQEKTNDKAEASADQSAHAGLTVNEKIIQSLKNTCKNSGELGNITIAGLDELGKQYKLRNKAEKFSTRKDPFANLAIQSGTNELRQKILSFKALFDSKYANSPQKVTFDSCFRDLYSLTDSSDTIKALKDDPNHLTGPIARALENDTFEIRNQFTEITRQFGALRKSSQETDLPPQAHIDNIVRDYQNFLYQKITGRSLS